MEGKQLNFSAPLLSVRRISSTLASSNGHKGRIVENPRPNRQISLPSYIPYSNTDQVTEPVAVPFRWEQIPGRAKDGGEPEPYLHDEVSSNTPRIPPGRVLDVIRKLPHIESENQNIFRPQNDASSLDETLTNLEGIHDEGNSDKESYSDSYSDAVDTMSPTSSLSLSGSVSGLSGSDGPDEKPSGTFSIDGQTRDLLMDRFLPAAKAMVLETPHYTSRKQSVVPEQPRQVSRMISKDTKPSNNKYSTDILPLYLQYEEEEGISEDEHDDYNASGNIPGCGLIPRFCLKNSLCLLDPIPGMKVRTQVPKSSARAIKKLVKKAYIRDHDRVVTKVTTGLLCISLYLYLRFYHAIFFLFPTDTDECFPGGGGVYKQNALNAFLPNQSDYEVQSPKLHEVWNMMMNEESNRTYSSESQATDGSSPYRHSSSGGGISPYRNEASHSPFHEGMGFLGLPKEVDNLKADRLTFYQAGKNISEILCHEENKLGPGSVSPIVEKTLYIDSVDVTDTQHPIDSYTKELMDNAGLDFRTLVERRGMEEASSAESSFQDIKCLSISKEGAILKLRAPGSVDSLPSSSDIPHIISQEDTLDSFRLDQGLEQELRSLEYSKGPIDGNLSINSEQILETDDQVDSNIKFLQSPVPPPLPKEPSESWLWRTVSLQKPCHRSKFLPRKQVPKPSSTDTKWETIVKTSKMNYDHVRYSEVTSS